MILIYSQESGEQIRILPPEIKKGIKQVIELLKQNPYSGKMLQKELMGFRSIAFKRYRIIYKILTEKNILRIYAVGARKNIYINFSRSLSEYS